MITKQPWIARCFIIVHSIEQWNMWPILKNFFFKKNFRTLIVLEKLDVLLLIWFMLITFLFQLNWRLFARYLIKKKMFRTCIIFKASGSVCQSLSYHPVWQSAVFCTANLMHIRNKFLKVLKVLKKKSIY